MSEPIERWGWKWFKKTGWASKDEGIERKFYEAAFETDPEHRGNEYWWVKIRFWAQKPTAACRYIVDTVNAGLATIEEFDGKEIN